MSHIDEQVRQWMEKVERSGEMRGMAGKPLDLDDGFDQTPQELRMAHRILKNAGYVPAEVEHLRRLDELRADLARAEQAKDETTRLEIQRKLAEQETQLRVRLESMRSHR